MIDTPLRRCAVYTRKSSEEGLDQEFNSLHAQREACEAFVKSQVGVGWRLLKTAYDDGGLSGGTMERPGLQQLLADVRERRVDIVVVYKVDRLTRSLADFARIVELFDTQGVSFVAVTQQFNTTTSMGRLTLNVLLSFAQFEREVIGERIRDKVAASKRKGLWMGGTLPLGYTVHDRRLVMVPKEVELVKLIFERYLALGSVRLLKRELDQRGLLSAVKVARNGKTRGGKPFSRGALYWLLGNRLYIGEIEHQQESFPGQHQAVINRALWDQVQRRLRNRAVRQGIGAPGSSPNPLTGKLFDEDGEPLYIQGAAKGRRRYRYYVSRHLVRGGASEDRPGWRLPAPEIELAVIAGLRVMLADQPALAQAAEAGTFDASLLPGLFSTAEQWCTQLADQKRRTMVLTDLVERVDLGKNQFSIKIKLPLPLPARGANHKIVVDRVLPLQLRRRGVESRLVLAGEVSPKRVDATLLRAVARARSWADQLITGQALAVRDLARREGVDRRSLARLLPLAFLAPAIVERLAQGRQPQDLSLMGLTRRTEIPLLWKAQGRALGIRQLD